MDGQSTTKKKTVGFFSGKFRCFDSLPEKNAHGASLNEISLLQTPQKKSHGESLDAGNG